MAIHILLFTLGLVLSSMTLYCQDAFESFIEFLKSASLMSLVRASESVRIIVDLEGPFAENTDLPSWNMLSDCFSLYLVRLVFP